MKTSEFCKGNNNVINGAEISILIKTEHNILFLIVLYEGICNFIQLCVISYHRES